MDLTLEENLEPLLRRKCPQTWCYASLNLETHEESKASGVDKIGFGRAACSLCTGM
jgi:hypothetical protein